MTSVTAVNALSEACTLAFEVMNNEAGRSGSDAGEGSVEKGEKISRGGWVGGTESNNGSRRRARSPFRIREGQKGLLKRKRERVPRLHCHELPAGLVFSSLSR